MAEMTNEPRRKFVDPLRNIRLVLLIVAGLVIVAAILDSKRADVLAPAINWIMGVWLVLRIASGVLKSRWKNSVK